VDSWLMWQLTGGKVHVTDVSNASRTMLFNVHTNEWDADLLKALDIPAALLGHTLPIGGVAGDQQSALFGQACFRPGQVKNTYGTGCFMLMNTGAQPVASRNRLLTTVGWQGPPGAHRTAYCLEGSVFVAGATVQWLRDGLQIIQSAPEVESLAAQVDDTGDVYLVPAFAGLGTPDWDGYARGALVGLTRGTTRAHIARAALEAIALQSADVFGAMTRDARIPLTELRVDGGASRNNLLMQMQADFLGVPVVRPQVTETTALGAAYLAGLATGFWRDADEIAGQWQADRRFEPRLEASQRVAKMARWRQAVERAKGWAKP
jgi:glycerol kinase